MKYKVIVATLKTNVTDHVVEAAKACGISGATIVPSHGTGMREAKTFLGLSLETQTDVVIFLAEEELVQPVMTAIHKAGKLDEHGTGVVFVLPVEQVDGIKEEIVRQQPD
ncbi:MAG: P-II family nitrogen regulator [Acidobacteriota bacterium]|nr:P-II family nitrogen regulator [Acidobacteriota bacterium]MDH3785507.1 P-II family nitrogen regulator [Acidobacteriota bacterium]